jgi:hypothetical protein
LHRFLLSLLLPVLLAAAVAPAAAAPTLRYRVTAATATARLSFTTGTGGASFVRGTVDARFTRKQAKRLSAADGSLTARGGRVRFPLAGRVLERVVTGERTDPTSPYVEQTCGDRRLPAGQGGLSFRRVSGGRVQARWAFPHPRVQLCPGPRINLRAIERTMIRLLPASRLAARRTTIVVAGSRPFRSGQYRGTYRWRASVKLVRV